MPLVHATPLCEEVASWVLETACRQAAHWHDAGHAIRIGINLSQSQFRTGDLAADVSRLIAETGLDPALLMLEVTEDIILDNVDAAQRTLTAIRALGVEIAFDDFGTGYGSLTYLKAFPLDKIKIDQSFVRGIHTNMDDAAIVASTIGLSKSLGLSVVAEGVEDARTAEFLLAVGCKEAQGYHFGRPVPVPEFESRFLGLSGSAAMVA